ncbi:MAG: transporter [Spirochaetaceae bacterium]|jgi:spore maturation protein SpmB|nr:transporter [Spirochaetaceae bacterium]
MEKTSPEKHGFFYRVGRTALNTVKPAFSTIWFLLYVMIPVSLMVLILDYSGILYHIARFMNPVMRFLDLPGEAALVFLSSIFINIYSAIAVIDTLSLTGREITILATMCLIAHNFFVECAVMKKTGSSLSKMVLLRILCALFAGWALRFIVPESAGRAASGMGLAHAGTIGFDPAGLPAVLLVWLMDSGVLILKIILIVFTLMFVQKLLEEFGVIRFLGKITGPVMKILGLSPNTGYLWIVANLAGLAYGAAILIEQVRSQAVSPSEADLFNHHVGISHSQLEDTLLFVAIGVPLFWAALPRLILAIIVVWLERIRRDLVRRSFRVKIAS